MTRLFASTFNQDLYESLEQACGRSFKKAIRDEIFYVSLSAYAALGTGRVNNPPSTATKTRLGRLSKSIARVQVDWASAIADDRAGSGTRRLIRRHIESRMPNGEVLSGNAAVENFVTTLGDARAAIDASLAIFDERANRSWSSKAPLWPLNRFILDLADIFEDAGGNANGHYQIGRTQPEGPFVRLVVLLCGHILAEIIEPDPDVERALSPGAVRSRTRRLLSKKPKAVKVRSNWQARRGRKQKT